MISLSFSVSPYFLKGCFTAIEMVGGDPSELTSKKVWKSKRKLCMFLWPTMVGVEETPDLQRKHG